MSSRGTDTDPDPASDKPGERASARSRKSSGRPSKKPSGRSSGKATYHHGDLRQAIIDAALDVIAEENVAAVSLRQLARRVGVSYAAPYHHFKDKNALLAAVAAEGFRKMHEILDAELASVGNSPVERFRTMGCSYVRFAVSHPAHYRVMFGHDLKERGEHPEMHEEGQRCFDSLLRGSAELLGASASEREVRTVAIVAWSSVHGLSMLWNDGPLSGTFEDYAIDDLNQMVNATLAQVLPALRS